MKANARAARFLLLLPPLLAAAACNSPRIVPPPPTPEPTRRAVPPALSRPAPSRPATPPAAETWRDVPITPGDWRWQPTGAGSQAVFGTGAGPALLELSCDRAGGTVRLRRSGAAVTGPMAMTVTATSGSRVVNAQPDASGGLVVALSARDSLLDTMAFSRGRFAVESAGAPTLYVPSWPELSRVVEDCRGA